MRRQQLKALLQSDSPLIVFDARGKGGIDPFFEHSVLKNAILFKTVGRASAGMPVPEIQTRLYVPFDPKSPGNGGMSLLFDEHVSAQALETFSGVKIDPAKIENDLAKLRLLSELPSFAPFLLRDAFDRSGLKFDSRFFRVTDVEADAMRDTLKAKLKPLAALALAADDVGDGRLDLLARKLWDLDDLNFLIPFGRALKIREGQTIEVLYAWIGVAFFQREFSKRQPKLKQLSEWLGPKPTGEQKETGLDADRNLVRDCLRRAWSEAVIMFERQNSTYDELINQSNAGPFIEYLQEVRADFDTLGACLTRLEHCLSIFEVAGLEDRGSRLGIELLQDLATSLRHGLDDKALAA